MFFQVHKYELKFVGKIVLVDCNFAVKILKYIGKKMLNIKYFVHKHFIFPISDVY